ncbi:MAG: hypothetical protein EOP13_24160 [Pseudomonas sp.]|nr:MAG: hypothetical protein EOP13_24160 [Pseudomonas sp.]
MADGGGPTERDRSEGTPTQEEPNQEQAPLVTWGAFPSNSPKAKPEAVRPTIAAAPRIPGTDYCPAPRNATTAAP